MENNTKAKLLKMVDIAIHTSSIITATLVDKFLKENLKNPKSQKSLVVRTLTMLGIYSTATAVNLACKFAELELRAKELDKSFEKELNKSFEDAKKAIDELCEKGSLMNERESKKETLSEASTKSKSKEIKPLVLKSSTFEPDENINLRKKYNNIGYCEKMNK